MVWRFRASEKGLQVIRESCRQMSWTRNTVCNDESLIEASKILEPCRSWPEEGFHGRIYADGIHEGSWRRFLMGKKPISAQVFVAYCLALKVTWEDVVDWSDVNSPIPFVALPRVPLTQKSCINFKSDQPPQDISEFVRDVTIPDGTIMQRGEEFTKVWEIRNAGNVAWKSRCLMRLGACSGPALMTSLARVKIPRTNPGESIEVSVKLKAPEVATTTTAIWKMTFDDGTLCFPDRYKYGLSVVIQVLQ